MTSPGGYGRTDDQQPLVSATTKAWLLLFAIPTAALLAWISAVVVSTPWDWSAWDRIVANVVQLRPLRAVPAPTVTVAAWLGLLVAAAGTIGGSARWWSSRTTASGGKGFAGGDEVREQMGEHRARQSARFTRPGLPARAARSVDLRAVGYPLGCAVGTRQPVVLSLEDHLIVVAPTGAGKSRDVMIPAALDAPGALVVTSTRADILDVIAEHRATCGRVWVFDPMGRLGWPEAMVWDPVAGCHDGATAIQRGLAFTAGMSADDKSSTNAGFFRTNAASALTRLLHAAAVGGADMADVLRWALRLDDGADEPIDLLRHAVGECVEADWADLLRNVATGAAATTASTRQTLAQAIEPLALRSVLRWVVPAAGVDVFDPAAFVDSRDTLVLVADASASTNVAPLCAMLLQEVVDAAKSFAARSPVGRLDPPLRLVGDEIANVAPLPKLPELATDARGFGIQMVLAVQSVRQARRRWGDHAAAAMLDNMSAELLLGGISDPETLNRYRDLVGEVDLERATVSVDDRGQRSGGSWASHTKHVMRTDEVRRIGDGHGLLIYRNRAPVMVTMTPWFDRDDAAALRAAQTRTAAARSLA